MATSFLRRHQRLLINVSSASGLLALGDLLAQLLYEKKSQVDDQRLVAAALTGTVMGVEGHLWYTFLDRLIAQPTWRNVLKKVLLDQTLAAPIYTTTYIMGEEQHSSHALEVVSHLGTSLLEGRSSPGELRDDAKTNFLPLYLADCAVFIPVQVINFKYISAFYRVPFMFFVAFIFNGFLSAYKHAPEKENKSE